MLKRTFIALNAYIREEMSQINNLRSYHTIQEKEQQNKSKASRWREIIKVRAKVNEIENKNIIEKINETKHWFFSQINKIGTPNKNNNEKKIEDTNFQYQEKKLRVITTDTSDIKRIKSEYYKQLTQIYLIIQMRWSNSSKNINVPHHIQYKIDNLTNPNYQEN